MYSQITNLWHSLGLFDDWFSTINTVFNIWLIVAQIRSHYKIKRLEQENTKLKQRNNISASIKNSHSTPKGL
jgi:hypothetical protein